MLLTHRQPSLWGNPRFVSPSVNPEVDWNHPLAANLVACYVPGSVAGLSDLAGVGPDLVSDVNGDFEFTPEGYGYGCRNVSAAAYSTTFPSEWDFPNGGTIYWRGSVLSTPTFGSGWPPLIFGITYSGAPDGTVSPVYGAALAVNVTSFGDRPAFLYYPNGGTGTDNVQLATTWDTLMVGKGPVAMGATFIPGSAIELYVWPPAGTAPSITNGTWSGAAFDSTQPWQVSIGSTQSMDSADSSNTITTSAYLWDRILSPQEMALLNAAPLAMLRPLTLPRRNSDPVPQGGFRRWNRTYLIR